MSSSRSLAGLTVAMLMAVLVTTGFAQTGSPPGFSNPPLLYDGPDPTAEYFLPGQSGMPGSSTLTPLPPPEFPTGSPDVAGTTESGLTGQRPSGAGPTLQETYSPQRWSTGLLTNRSEITSNRGIADQPEAIWPNAQPEAIAPPMVRDPGGVGELMFPADGLAPSGTLAWPPEDFSMAPLEMNDGGITEHKEGFFQALCVTGTWIDRNNKLDDYGITEVDLKTTFAVPLPSRDWPLLITPAFNTRFLDGPQGINLPPRLYETYVDLTWVPRLNARWTGILTVAPSVYSDFQRSTDAFRMTGRALVRYDWRPHELQVIVGVLYLGREDVTILPAGGVIWTPNDRIHYEVIFPRPKLAHLIRREARFEDWAYLGAEFGGNSYAIERVPGTTEKITLRDYRLYLGLERKLNGGAGFRLEIGYVWGRVIEFASGLPDLPADDTAMIRGGITF